MGVPSPDAVKAPPWTARRRAGALVRPQLRKAAQRLGDLTLAWNAAHEGLFEIMRVLMCDGDFVRARDLWLSIDSDKARGRVIGAFAKTALIKRKTLAGAVQWVVGRISKLADTRNDAVHMHLMDWGGDAVPHHLMTKEGSLKRWQKQPWEAEVSLLCGDLRAMGDYATGIAMAIRDGRPRPYVLRPALRSTPALTAAKSERDGKAKKRQEALRASSRQ
jgi:hypothetical protein